MLKRYAFPSFLNNQALHLIFFGGKGGVGKTTLACASAVYLAQNKPNKKVLIISVDPSHSLKDVFSQAVGGKPRNPALSAPQRSYEVRKGGVLPRKPTVIKGLANLYSLELDVNQVSDDFKQQYLPVIKSIALNGSYLDREDISTLFSLSIPGLDDATTILEIDRLYRSRQYDLMIIDTASSGYTFRFLRFYSQMRRWLRLFQLMKLKHRYISTVFTKTYLKDETDEFLEAIDKDIEDAKFFFKNIKSTEFIPVLTPEAMSIKETERLIAVLKEEKIPVRDIIINQILDEKQQAAALDQINKRFKQYNIIKIPLFSKNIIGVENLRSLGQMLTTGPKPSQPAISLETYTDSDGLTDTQMNQNLLEIFNNHQLRFIIFGGKAGSGKTTLASAAAIHLADRYPDKKIMLFSIDPAHSLADSFDLPIGNKETSIPGFHNLYAIEVEGTRIWDERKIKYKKSINRAFSRYRDNPERSLDVVSSELKFDREIMIEFVEATPPHVNESIAVEKLMEFAINNRYDLYILDTGPIAQQLRLLELPSITLAWTKIVIDILHKYRKFIRFDEPISKLLLLKRDMRKMANILINESITEFVTVTTPSALDLLEIERLLFRIGQERIPNHHIVINKIMPSIKGSDSYLAKTREQDKYIQYIKNLETSTPVDSKSSGMTNIQRGKHLTGPKHKISLVPLFSYEINGLDNLRRFSEGLYGSSITSPCNGVREAMAESA